MEGIVTEAARLACLRSLDILDTASEEAFDRLTRLAAKALGTPIAITGLVDEARVWLKSKVGTDLAECPSDDAFCPHTIAGDGVLVVEDATRDPRFLASSLVTDGGIRFYAGAPIALANGFRVGTICVLDEKTHPPLDEDATALLEGLAAAAGHLLDLRRELVLRRVAEQRLTEHARLLELAEEMAGIGTWRLDFRTGSLTLSPAVLTIHGLDASQPAPDLDVLLALYEPADRSKIIGLIEAARTEGSGYTFDARLRRATDGVVREVSAKAMVAFDADRRPETLIGVFRDVTEEKKALDLLSEQRAAADRRAHRMSHLASTDLLTGLRNRRAFLEQAQQALGGGAGVGLAILDLDHFKSVNDRFGHEGGDVVLAAFGQLCLALGDSSHLFGRIGGEEFAVLVLGEDLASFTSFVERLRSRLAALSVNMRGGIGLRLSVSAGLAQAQPGDDWAALFRRADKALYQAKNEGRDRIATAA